MSNDYVTYPSTIFLLGGGVGGRGGGGVEGGLNIEGSHVKTLFAVLCCLTNYNKGPRIP